MFCQNFRKEILTVDATSQTFSADENSADENSAVNMANIAG